LRNESFFSAPQLKRDSLDSGTNFAVVCIRDMPLRSILPLGSLGLALLGALDCSQPSDQGQRLHEAWTRVVGRIDAGPAGSQAALQTPDTVRAGVAFSVTVSTYGGTGCIRPDQSDVGRAPSSASITVYDSLWVGSPPCLPDWHQYPRTLELRFDLAGSAFVRLHGRGADSTLTFQRAITVRP